MVDDGGGVGGGVGSVGDVGGVSGIGGIGGSGCGGGGGVVTVVVMIVVVMIVAMAAVLVVDIRYQGPPPVLLSPHLLGLDRRHGLLAHRRLQGVVELEALRGRHGEVARELARLPVQNR